MDLVTVTCLILLWSVSHSQAQSTTDPTDPTSSCTLSSGQEILTITLSDTQCSIGNSLSAKIESLERRVQTFSEHACLPSVDKSDDSFQFFTNLSQEIIQNLVEALSNQSSSGHCEGQMSRVMAFSQELDRLKQDFSTQQENQKQSQQLLQMKITQTRKLFDTLRKNYNISINSSSTKDGIILQEDKNEEMETILLQKFKDQRIRDNEDKLYNHTLHEMSQVQSELMKLIDNLTATHIMTSTHVDTALQQRVISIQSDVENMKIKVENLSLAFATLKHDIEERLKNRRMTTASNEMNHENTEITRSTCNGERRHLIFNSCYMIPLRARNEQLFTWWDARYYCKRHLGGKADLVAIETKEESDRIIDMLQNHFGGIQEFWLSGNDLETEGQWIWASNGKPIHNLYNNVYQSYQIKNTLKNCLSMLRGHQWVAEPCFFTRSPICELSLD